MKKISVITVSLNAETSIENTITSITEQTYPNTEYIVIDGGSTDSTVNIIKKHSSDIHYWISEKDNGIADAMNKGASQANGDYLIFINADDYLIDKFSLENAAKYFNSTDEIYVCQVYLNREPDRILSINRGFSWHTNFKMGSCHQGQLFSRKLFNKLGGFDADFSIGMDYDLLLRAYRSGSSALQINIPISVMGPDGISSRRNWAGQFERLDDERRSHYKNTADPALRFIYRIYWPLYLFYRKAMHTLKVSGYH